MKNNPLESGQVEQLAALELPFANGGPEAEPSASGLSRQIETIWSQLSSRGAYSEVLVLQPGLVRGRLDLSPAPAIVLSLPRMAMPSDQRLHPVSTPWPVEPQWLEWLGAYGLYQRLLLLPPASPATGVPPPSPKCAKPPYPPPPLRPDFPPPARPPRPGEAWLDALFCKSRWSRWSSLSLTVRQRPGLRPSRLRGGSPSIKSMATRTSRRVGRPTAAVMRRT